jgi:putative addiction module killer protein
MQMIVKQTEIFQKWFKKVRDEMAKATIIRRIRAIEQDGYFGDTKPVGEGISELRIHYGAGFRVYYIQRAHEIVILLCGGIKANKKGQQEDIKTAKQIAQEV